jgi:hypothetical protein
VSDRPATEPAAGQASPGPELADLAAAVLRSDDAGAYTVPSQLTYPHQWNWDSALCSLGWAELDPERAWAELLSLAGARYGDGLVPHIAFRPPVYLPPTPLTFVLPRWGGYMPGPNWWGRRRGADGRRISAITQPPLAATCMRLLFERAPDERRARALLGPFDAWHRFLLTARDPDGRGEPVLIHPWESGRDNAAEWDEPLARVKARVRVVHRRDIHTVDAAERPSDEHYRQFLSLVRAGTRAGWPQAELARSGEFRVLDPGFSAILARACADLAHLAGELGETELHERNLEAAERVSRGLARRTDSDGFLWPVDLVSGKELRTLSAGTALAVLDPAADQRRVGAMRGLVAREGPLGSAYGVRSLDAADPRLRPRGYWRGPVWANITWLCAHALEGHGERAAAQELRTRILQAVDRGGMREYFEPSSGAGLGARDFAWTAALTLRELATPKRDEASKSGE